MDFSGERYYKLNRILLTAIGLWPYNNSTFKQIQRILYSLLLGFSICVQLGKIITSVTNLESLFEILSFAIPCLIFSLKYATFSLKSEQIKQLIEKMKYNWNIIKCKEETEIFQQYANIGSLISISLATIFYASMVTFLITQILPKVLDVVAPLNESRPCELLGLAAMVFDEEKYFIPIFMHMTVALFVEMSTLLATETMFIIYFQHCCALFKITSFRIEHAFNCELHISVVEKNAKYHTNIIDAVVAHNTAIEYFNYVHYTFESSYFALMVLGISSLSINMFYFLLAGITREMKKLIASGILIFIHFLYVFMCNFVAQFVTNYSIEIFYKTCELSWYSVPLRLQKMLLFIMQRSINGCIFTLGSIFDASLAFCATVSDILRTCARNRY